MRNFELQRKLQQMLEKLELLDDDLEVYHEDGPDVVGVSNIYQEHRIENGEPDWIAIRIV